MFERKPPPRSVRRLSTFSEGACVDPESLSCAAGVRGRGEYHGFVCAPLRCAPLGQRRRGAPWGLLDANWGHDCVCAGLLCLWVVADGHASSGGLPITTTIDPCSKAGLKPNHDRFCSPVSLLDHLLFDADLLGLSRRSVSGGGLGVLSGASLGIFSVWLFSANSGLVPRLRRHVFACRWRTVPCREQRSTMLPRARW